MVWKCHDILCNFFGFFGLEVTLGKDTKMKATSVTVLVIFSKVPFQNFSDHN